MTNPKAEEAANGEAMSENSFMERRSGFAKTDGKGSSMG